MLLSALVIGALTAYYFGLRAGAWAAGVTFVVSLAALILPRYAWPLHAIVALGAVVIWRVGSKRQRPPDAIMAVGLLRRAAGRAWDRVRGKRD